MAYLIKDGFNKLSAESKILPATTNINSLIEPLENIIWSTGDETLGSILGLASSGHEPIWILEEPENTKSFQGLVSPYSTFYKVRRPYSTKASSIMKFPPHIYRDSDLSLVVSSMLSTRFYTLPIFDQKNEVIGMIKAKGIFKYLLKSKDLFNLVADHLIIKKPITINNNSSANEAYQRLRHKGISRLIVTDEKGKLIAILSRNDLKEAFISPPNRQRFSKSFGEVGQAMFDREPVKWADLPIKKYYKTDVLKINIGSSRALILEKLIKSNCNSIVMVGTIAQPMGFVSNRDLLQAISATIA